MIIIGPMEIFFPIIGVLILISGAFYIIALIGFKMELKNALEKGTVIFPETLFNDINAMKRDATLRLYSKRIDTHVYVVTASEITEEFKDGHFISYDSATPKNLKAYKTSMKQFLEKFPELDYKSMVIRKGAQVRIQLKQDDKNGF